MMSEAASLSSTEILISAPPPSHPDRGANQLPPQERGIHDAVTLATETLPRDLNTEIRERVRAEKNLQQQFARMNLLNQITTATSDLQELDHILRATLLQLEKNLSIDFGAVFLLDAAAEALNVGAIQYKPVQASAPPALRERERLPLAETGLADCVSGRTVYAKNTAAAVFGLFQTLATSGLRSAVAVPLSVAGTTLGVLLGARRTSDAFTSGECEFFRMLSDHVAVAVHHAKLYEQLHKAYEELKETQQAIMQQERLRALGEMASGIAHDINNALSPIIVYSELILLSEPDLSEASRRHLHSVKTAGQDIAHFVARLRDFYRKREASDDLSLVNFNQLVEQAIDLTRPRWHDIPLQNGSVITLERELGADLPSMYANAAELREALTNLILNAVDAMPAGGKLSVNTRLESSQRSGVARIVIEVSDTGTGMDEKTRARCLEPFFSTKGQSGTGLGLAMVYGIMERHGGRIEIDSAIGKGTTMRLIMPVREDQNTSLPEETLTSIPTPMRILYIEDEPLLRTLLKETLVFDGHSVSVAEHGEIGIAAVRAAARTPEPFDIVITDLGMPQVDGRQVADTLKREFPQLPVVMLTGWGTMLDDRPSSVDAVISKPPRIHELRETLKRLGDQSRQITAEN